MTKLKNLAIIFLLLINLSLLGQKQTLIPDLTKSDDPKLWNLFNRDLIINDHIYLNNKPGNGVLWMKDINFQNGVIDVDIKGKDKRGLSFVGIAFHGVDKNTYDAVYFRPFNFLDPDRSNHSVQYISHPKYTWDYLRQNFPEDYESALNHKIEPEEWFHVTIKIKYPKINVYINGDKTSTLSIDQISQQSNGWVGFWVGNNSDGYFRNLKINNE